MKKQYVFIAGACVCALAAGLLMAGFGKKGADSNEDLYGKMIAELGDNEQFSLCDIGEKNNVLFTTDMTYDDGNGHNAAVYCDVHYGDGKEVYSIGIMSMGTAYPVSYGKKCIYTASGHSLVVYTFDQKIPGWSMGTYEESFDEDGNVSYYYRKEEDTKEISEKEYRAAWDEYGKSTVVNFGYGASDNGF